MSVQNKIKKDQEFRAIYRKGQSMANRLLILYAMKTGQPETRTGFTVSKKKIGKSVERNHVKRLMKESYRLNQHRVKKGFDLIVVAREGCKTATYQQVESALLHILRKMNLLEKSGRE